MVHPVSNRPDYNSGYYEAFGYDPLVKEESIGRTIVRNVIVIASYLPGVSVITALFKLIAGILFASGKCKEDHPPIGADQIRWAKGIKDRCESDNKLGKALIGRAVAEFLCVGILLAIPDIVITILRHKQNSVENLRQA